jgi:hypothetical protein
MGTTEVKLLFISSGVHYYYTGAQPEVKLLFISSGVQSSLYTTLEKTKLNLLYSISLLADTRMPFS